jgi:hypothetical protein
VDIFLNGYLILSCVIEKETAHGHTRPGTIKHVLGGAALASPKIWNESFASLSLPFKALDTRISDGFHLHPQQL